MCMQVYDVLHNVGLFLKLHSSLMTPLHLASRNNHVEAASLLISAGAKLDIKDEEGKASTTILRTSIVGISLTVPPISLCIFSSARYGHNVVYIFLLGLMLCSYCRFVLIEA